MITGRQIRAARGLLGWKAEDLAKRAEVARETISKIEADLVQPHEKTMVRIARVFDESGIQFTDNSGVKFKSKEVEIFEGRERFDEFYEFIYEHLKRYGGEVCLSVVDERMLAKYRKDPDLHRKRMEELVNRGDVTFRVLATESNFITNYAQLKWQPEKQSTVPTSFYAFGDCLALISFDHENPPYVVLLKSGPFTEAYRHAFNIAWKNAKEPPKPVQRRS